jgi:hypothetical protein
MRNWHGNLSPFGSWHTGRRAFNPRTLFALAEPGVWFDPSPLTCFTDTAGTTPAAVGQSVALMLDKSRGATVKLGDELVTNGGFAANTDWTTGTGWAIGSGVATKTAGTAAVLSQAVVLTTGRAYELTYTLTRTAGTLTPRITGGTTVNFTARTAGGTFTQIVSAVTGNTTLEFSADASFAGTIDNVTVKELTGNHAQQDITASRPTLARVPANGRRNLLTRTEEFDNAFWNKIGTTTVTSVGDGAWRINNFDAVEGDRLTNAAVTVGASATVNGAIEVRGEGSDIGKVMRLVVKRSGGGGFTGVVVTTTLTGDWQRINGSFTLGADNTAFQIALATNLADGTLPAAPLVRFPQGELGSTATAYQKVTSTFDVTEAGQADNWHLSFDGIDDSMVTPTITPGTDKVQVFAGVRKVSDAGNFPALVEFGNGASGPNAFAVFAPASTTTASYEFRSFGASSANSGVSTGYAAPITNVLTARGDIATRSSSLRIDGAQVASFGPSSDTGNYAAEVLKLGRRSTSPFYNGHIYSLIARFGPNLPTDTIEKVEKYIANRTAGVSL